MSRCARCKQPADAGTYCIMCALLRNEILVLCNRTASLADSMRTALRLGADVRVIRTYTTAAIVALVSAKELLDQETETP